MRIIGKTRKLNVLVVSAIVLLLLLAVLPLIPEANCTSSTVEDLKQRQLLGVCSHDVAERTKAKIPSSEWGSFRNVRLTLPWASVEAAGKGTFRWGRSDRRINEALSLGVNSIMLTIGRDIPNWARNPKAAHPAKAPPRHLRDFEDFCFAVAERYSGIVDYYQIWQEPGWDLDAPPAAEGVVYFSGHCDLDYMGLLRAGYNGVKKANPDAYVVTGSMMNSLTRGPEDFHNYSFLLDGGGQDLSMRIEADQDIVAERPMYFNYKGVWPGGHVEKGVAQPLQKWYLAEGATHPNIDQWITIQNPDRRPASVKITYMFPGGGTAEQNLSITGRSRYTLSVNQAVGPDKNVSAMLESDVPIIVERPMYFNYKGAWPGGHVESGVARPAETWYLAEGATHEGFEQWISLMNPQAAEVDVEITYMFPGGKTQVQELTMPPTSRDTILVNNVVGPNRDVSTRVEASAPIIAERPMYFNYKGAWAGGHVEVGVTSPANSWFVSEGTTRNNPNDGSFEEWLSIQNPGNRAAEIDVTYMFTDGTTSSSSLEIPPLARDTIDVNRAVGTDRDVSVQLDSSEPIIVERAMYFNYKNVWPGGHAEVASSRAGQNWYFAEGTTRQGFEEWLTLQNPGSQPANVSIRFMFGDATNQVKSIQLAAHSRTTVSINHSVSMATICDGIAIHPYDYPEFWKVYYSTLAEMVASRGFDNEVMVTEIGWPHGGRAEFNMETQRRAIGEVGVGGLWGAGCRKIWIYEDVGDPAGQSWDDAENGLFTYRGAPTPAWNEYKKWQSMLPDYGNKPGHLPW